MVCGDHDGMLCFVSFGRPKGMPPDVGGGFKLAKPPPSKPTLSRIALRWMVGECFDANTRILFKRDAIQRLLENGMEEDRLAAIDPNDIEDETDAGILKRIGWWSMEVLMTLREQSYLLRAERHCSSCLTFIHWPSIFQRRDNSGRGIQVPYNGKDADKPSGWV